MDRDLFWLLVVAFFLMALVVLRGPVDDCTCPDLSTVKRILNYAGRYEGEVCLNDEDIDFLIDQWTTKVQTCSCPDPAHINAIFERDMRGEVRLDQQTIDFLNSLEVRR